MPSTGGSAPYPSRYGGGTPVLVSILDGLNAARGTAYDTQHDSNVYAENMAHARALAGLWSTNQRLANQFDPSRVTSMLPRWEKILGIAPRDSETLPARRRELVARWLRVGQDPTTQTIVDELSSRLGPTFVAMFHETTSSALVYWPGGTPNPAAPWYSTIARVVVQLQQPTAMSDGEFYDQVQKLTTVLDARLPAWMTWSWWRNDKVAGVKGFYLDSPANLDNDAFDV